MDFSNSRYSRRKFLKIALPGSVGLAGSMLIDINNQNMKAEASYGRVLVLSSLAISGGLYWLDQAKTLIAQRADVGIQNRSNQTAQGQVKATGYDNNAQPVAVTEYYINYNIQPQQIVHYPTTFVFSNPCEILQQAPTIQSANLM